MKIWRKKIGVVWRPLKNTLRPQADMKRSFSTSDLTNCLSKPGFSGCKLSSVLGPVAAQLCSVWQ